MKHLKRQTLFIIVILSLAAVFGWRPPASSAATETMIHAPVVVVLDDYALESDDSVNFPVKVIGTLEQPLDIAYCTEDGTALADIDYYPLCGVITFAVAEGYYHSQEISIQLIDDPDPEENKAFYIEIDEPTSGVILVKRRATAWIGDDDWTDGMARVRFVHPFTEVLEKHDGELLLEVQLTKALENQASVGVQIERSHDMDDDFDLLTTKLDFPPGSVSQSIRIDIKDDDEPEGEESFILGLYNPSTNLKLAPFRQKAKITIVDDDAGDMQRTQVYFNDKAIRVAENSGEIALDVHLANPLSMEASVKVRAEPTEGMEEDFQLKTTDLTFGIGSTMETIDITIDDDEKPEPEETFEVILYDPTDNLRLTHRNRFFVTIEDDDETVNPNDIIVGFEQQEYLVGEETTAFDVKLLLSESPISGVTTRITSIPGTAEEGVDYVKIDETIDIPAGSALEIPYTVHLKANTVKSGERYFIVKLLNGQGTKPKQPTNKAEVTIFEPTPVYLPFVRHSDGWKPVAQPQRPANAEFDRFYSVAQCGYQENSVTRDFTFAGADNGLFLLDKGGPWVKVPGIPSLFVNNVLFANEECTRVYAAVFGNGDRGNGLAGVWEGNLLLDNRWRWGRVGGLEPKAEYSTWSMTIFDDKLLVGTDVGLRWTALPLPSNLPTWEGPGDLRGFVTSFAQDEDGKLLATVWGDGVYDAKSIENGQWDLIQGGPANKNIYQAGRNKMGLAAGTTTDIFNYKAGIWTPLNRNIRTYAILANGPIMYAGQRAEQIQYSLDGGKTWKPMPDLPSTASGGEEFQVRGFHVGTDGYLYAATSSGVWRWTGRP